MRIHGLRKGTAQILCGTWVSFTPKGVINLHKNGQPVIQTSHLHKNVTCLKCRSSRHFKLLRRDEKP